MTATDFQRASTVQGQAFADAAAVMLRSRHNCTIEVSGWVEPTTHIEIDHVAWHPDIGEIWVECKGSWQGKRPGLIRTDTLKKAIANAAVLATLETPCPYWLVVSHLPLPGSVGAVWLDRIGYLFNRIELL